MEDKYKIPYINACIRAFSKRFQISVKSAFQYLYLFQALQSIDDAVDDLIAFCRKNGGQLQ